MKPSKVTWWWKLLWEISLVVWLPDLATKSTECPIELGLRQTMDVFSAQVCPMQDLGYCCLSKSRFNWCPVFYLATFLRGYQSNALMRVLSRPLEGTSAGWL